MQMNKNIAAEQRPRFSMKSDVNGLWVIFAVLVALLLLPGPSEAEFHARDIKMNDIVVVEDMKSKN